MEMPERQQLLEMYYRMSVTRSFNEKFIEMKIAGDVYGPIHHIHGQEAIGIAIGAALNDRDIIISNHRGYSHWIGKGIDLKKLAAEILGKADGCCHGKAGEMLITDISKGIISTTIVGAGMPLAVGLGMSSRMLKSNHVVVVYFGDGAANEGTFHESLNFGALRKVPVVFLCENNQWALSVNVRTSTAVRDIAIRAIGYDIPGYIVDGNDVFDLYELMQEVLPRLREGGGPVLVEAKTYRRGPFSTNDRESGYQSADEILRWQAKDPIKRFGEQLCDLGMADEKALAALREKALADSLEAIEYAVEAAYPHVDELYTNVFATA